MRNSIILICYFLFYLCTGTKIDLREDKEALGQLANVNKQPFKKADGEKLCAKIGAVKYMECSALTQKYLKLVSFYAILYVPIFCIIFLNLCDLFRKED